MSSRFCALEWIKPSPTAMTMISKNFFMLVIGTSAGFAGEFMIIAALTPVKEFSEKVFGLNAVPSEQNEAMIPQIAHFVEDLLNVIIFRGDDSFDGLFADFFKNFIVAHIEKVISIGAFDGAFLTVFNDGIEFVQHKGQIFWWLVDDGGQTIILVEPAPAEAGISTGMTRDAFLMNFNK